MKKHCAYVVVRKFPFEVANREVLPKAREEEIAGCQSDKVKTEKFYAWKLLEEVLAEKFGRSISDTYFDKTIGKWKMNELHLSISHSFDVVAIAVSTEPIGVDVELLNDERFAKLKQEKILGECEQSGDWSPKDLCILWSQKEAVFKTLDKASFVPREMRVNDGVQSQLLDIDGREFVLSVASDCHAVSINNECK